MPIATIGTALVGVGVGATLSFATSSITEHLRYRREQRVRSRDRRLDAYTDFAVLAKETMSILYRVAAAQGADDQTEPLTIDEAKPMLADAYHRRDPAFERVLLVGSPEVIRTLRDWQSAIYDMRRMAAQATIERAEWQASVKEANRHRSAFHAAARTDLDVPELPSLDEQGRTIE